MTSTETVAPVCPPGVPKPGWAYRLVAKWCERRARDIDTHKLLTRCRTAYRTGPLVQPVREFAVVLEAQMLENATEWNRMAKRMREAADREGRRADTPNAAASLGFKELP